MFDLIFRFLSSLASTALPILGSFRALQQNDVSLIRSWLMYWVVVSIQFSAESYFGFLFFFLPFFQLFRFIFILWMVLPQTQGATQIYINYVGPFLVEHEGEIDKYIAKIHNKLYALSTEYVGKLIFYVKEYVFRIITGAEPREYQVPQQQQQQQPQTLKMSNFFPRQADQDTGAGANNAAGAAATVTTASTVLSKLFSKSSAAAAPSQASPGAANFSGTFPTQQKFEAQPTYLDSFFAKFKNPPSLATDGAFSKPGASPSSRPTSRSSLDAASDPNSYPAYPNTIWNSILEPIARTGAAAIQTSLHLPKITPEVYNAQIRAYTQSQGIFGGPQSSGNNPEFDAVSSGASIYSSTSYATTVTGGSTLKSRGIGPHTSSSASLYSTASVSSTGSSSPTKRHSFPQAQQGIPEKPVGVLGSLPRNQRDSTSSLSASDMDFDFVRHSEYDGSTTPLISAQKYPEEGFDPNAPLLPPSQQRRSSGWFGWRRNSSSSGSSVKLE